MAYDIIIILLLLILNGFFALSEMAVVSSSKPILRQLAKQGKKRAAMALELAEDSGRFLSTVQVGITLVGIFAGAYGGATIAARLSPVLDAIPSLSGHGDWIAMVLVVGLITYASVVMGELVPKQLALRHSEAIAMWTALPMQVISKSFAPIVWLLENSAKLLMFLLGSAKATDEQMTEAEVKAVLAEGAASGAIEADEHQMFQRIIRLGDKDVSSIMTHRLDVIAISVKDDLATIRQKLHEGGHSRYPVLDTDGETIIGMVHTKEMLEHLLDDQNRTENSWQLAPIIQDIRFVPETASCLKVMDMFKTSGAHMVVVVDEYGSTEGIVTPSDILQAIVGAMPSNYGDLESPLIFQREDGSWLMDGQTPIDEALLTIGLDEHSLEDGDFDTLTGFIMHQLSKAPELGDVAEFQNFRFEIVDMDGRRVDKVLVTPATNNHGDASLAATG